MTTDAPASQPASQPASRLTPFSAIVGQDDMKLALKLAYVQPAISGVLLTGERGTAKSTIVRAFARILYDSDKPLVVLPINATEDRVVGGWDVEKLVGESETCEKPGLLAEANGRILYIDEVNLLDDHIVNLILDAAASGELVIQREGLQHTVPLRFTMVGTMNPEEGTLRPQLLDRFDLCVQVRAEAERRVEVVTRMLALDASGPGADGSDGTDLLRGYREQDEALRTGLDQAKLRCRQVKIDEEVINACVLLATRLEADGHRGECVLARAAQASAALDGLDRVTRAHLRPLARLAFQHRIRPAQGGEGWGPAQDGIVKDVLKLPEA